MLRLAAFAAAAALAAAETCRFNRTSESCPVEGQACTQAIMCQAGSYCKVDRIGQGAGVYSGTCARGPRIEDVYKKPCDFSAAHRQCQFDNPLAMSPRALPNSLRCTSSTDGPGLCLLGPQKHGDGCNEEQECASGNCVKALRICKGVELGDPCAPGFPDPCAPGTYCELFSGNALGGRCISVMSANRPCTSVSSCARGTFCSGASFDAQICIPPFSLPAGANSTLGPYMCESANALQVSVNPPVFQCTPAEPVLAMVGQPCDTRNPLPAGYECKCARQGMTLVRSVGGFGLSARAAVWKDLHKCLMKATDPMGKPCSFDVGDLDTMRYGSCGFYGCYPLYVKLVELTGSRFFKDPLLGWEPTAQCEVDAATKYFERMVSTPCIQIPNMEAWKCATSLGPVSLSVQDTSGVIAFIFIVVWGGYLYHMWRFRHENGVTFPCARLNK